MSIMWKVTLLFTVIISITNGVDAAPLPCDYPLRILRPQMFKHCTCSYGDWSNWYRIGHSVSSSQCTSGYAYQLERMRKDYYGKCEEETERQYQCELLLVRCMY